MTGIHTYYLVHGTTNLLYNFAFTMLDIRLLNILEHVISTHSACPNLHLFKETSF